MSGKHKKVCTTLNYIEHFLILASTITGCVSVPAFASLIGIAIGIISSAIAAGVKKHKSIFKKKKNKHDKIVLLAKSKLNIIEVLISKVLINSVISHDEFLLKEYDEMKEEIFKTMLSYSMKCGKNTEKLQGQKIEE